MWFNLLGRRISGLMIDGLNRQVKLFVLELILFEALYNDKQIDYGNHLVQTGPVEI
jgi:hypothetical protein